MRYRLSAFIYMGKFKRLWTVNSFRAAKRKGVCVTDAYAPAFHSAGWVGFSQKFTLGGPW